jgi:hypothetical protein
VRYSCLDRRTVEQHVKALWLPAVNATLRLERPAVFGCSAAAIAARHAGCPEGSQVLANRTASYRRQSRPDVSEDATSRDMRDSPLKADGLRRSGGCVAQIDISSTAPVARSARQGNAVRSANGTAAQRSFSISTTPSGKWRWWSCEHAVPVSRNTPRVTQRHDLHRCATGALPWSPRIRTCATTSRGGGSMPARARRGGLRLGDGGCRLRGSYAARNAVALSGCAAGAADSERNGCSRCRTATPTSSASGLEYFERHVMHVPRAHQLDPRVFRHLFDACG